MTVAQPDAGIKTLMLEHNAPPMLAGFPRYGALAMYVVQTMPRPVWATMGASITMLLLSHLLAAVDGGQGPAWLAAIAGSTGVGGGLAALAYHAYREWREKSRDDRREAEALARLDTREREFVARMAREYQEHKRQIREELTEHHKRLDAINAEIAQAAERRHKWAKGVNRDVLELETRLQDQSREIEQLKTIIASRETQ